jgi:muramidase (phage lysozyme)
MKRDAAALSALLPDGNVQAFLRVIRAGEGTADEDGYRRQFGGKLFSSFADHPRELVTAWLGTTQITSTAAGAYQFLERTWDGLVKQYGFRDFGPRTQDVAALALIDGRGALDDVLNGRIEQAITKCNKEWASLPGSPYGQPTRTMAQALATFAQATSTSPKEQTPMLPLIPFVASALPYLIEAAPALIRVFGSSPQAEKNAKAAEAVAQIAKDVTGQPTVEGAVAAIQGNPTVAAQFREKVHLSMGELLGLMESVNAMDQKAIAAARDYNTAEPPFLVFMGLHLKFIHLLSLIFVSFSGWFVLKYWGDLTPELRGSVVTLMMIAGYNGVRDYWMGSSSGSDRKTSEIIKQRES